jgi:hypothetical protein
LVNTGGNVYSESVLDEDGWPRIAGGHGGKTFVEGPSMLFWRQEQYNEYDEFKTTQRSILTWNTCVSRSAKKWEQRVRGN